MDKLLLVPTIRYQYREHLGSSTIEANEHGQVISYEEYYPYGASAYRVFTTQEGVSLKRYRFTDKEKDDETGLYYFGVRYYMPWLGRWTASDPGGFVDGVNLYRYVRNNPVNGVDEMGYATDSIHLDKHGNEIARYNDDDDTVYIHDDLDISSQHIDGARSVLDQRREIDGTGGGGRRYIQAYEESYIQQNKGPLILSPVIIEAAKGGTTTAAAEAGGGGAMSTLGGAIGTFFLTALLVIIPQPTGGPDAAYYVRQRERDEELGLYDQTGSDDNIDEQPGIDNEKIPDSSVDDDRDDDELLTFYRGVGFYNALEIVEKQDFDVAKIIADQALNPKIDPKGLYLAHDPEVARYWASTYPHAGGESVLIMQVKRKEWKKLVKKYPNLIEFRVSSDMDEVFTETVIPYEAIKEFTDLTKQTGGIRIFY